MAGQKERWIRRFRKEAKKKNQAVRDAGLNCLCGSCNLATFNIKEIEDIINWKDGEEEDER